MTEYKFLPNSPNGSLSYDMSGNLATLARLSPGDPLDGLFFVPVTDTSGASPKTSSVSVLSAPGGDGSQASLLGSLYQGKPLDSEYQVGDTHPSATAIVRRGALEVLYRRQSQRRQPGPGPDQQQPQAAGLRPVPAASDAGRRP